MPIPVYGQRTNAPTGLQLATRQTQPNALGEVGSALQAGAGLLQQQQALAKQKDEERAAVFANESLMSSRAKWVEEFQKRQNEAGESAEGFSLSVLEAFDTDSQERIQKAPTEQSRQYLKQRLSETRLALQQDALQFEARRGVEYKASGLDRALNTARTAAEFSPNSFATILAEQRAAIDASGLPADIQAKARQASQDALATASVEGQIRRNPYSALKDLNNEKTENLAVKSLDFDARQTLRNRAEAEIRQREAEQRQRQGEAQQALAVQTRDAVAAYRQGLNFDNPPTRAQFVAAMGADGQKAYESFQKEQQLGSDLAQLATLPPEEQTKLLKARSPGDLGDTATAGVAEKTERYRVLIAQAQGLERAKQEDPAAYVSRYSPRIAQLQAQSNTPEGAQAFANATLAEQRYLGVQNPRVLTDAQASELAQSFGRAGGEEVSQLLQQEQQRWGDAWPKVYGELTAKKIPAAALAIGRGMSPGASTRLAGVANLPFDELQKGVENKPGEVNDELNTQFAEFGKAMAVGVGGGQVFAGMYEAAQRLTYSYLRQGQSLQDSAARAYNEVIGDHYAFHTLNDQTYRVPREIDGRYIDDNAVSDGAATAIRKVPVQDLQLPEALQFSDEATVKRELSNAIIKRGYFGTSPQGEDGLTLFLDGFPMLRKDGNPYTLSWDELTQIAVETEERSRAERREIDNTVRMR